MNDFEQPWQFAGAFCFGLSDLFCLRLTAGRGALNAEIVVRIHEAKLWELRLGPDFKKKA
jgi:hypothetical protein